MKEELKMEKDQFGNRMKLYEGIEASRKLMPLNPVCIRVDGKNFSKFTRNFTRPFDMQFHEVMRHVTMKLVEETNARIGYTQSDEISLILKSDSIDSQIFFDGKIQKINSVIASMATFYFQDGLRKYYPAKYGDLAFFDCRVWNTPNEMEAANTLIWRDLDCFKNAISMASRCYYSHSDLHNKSCSEMQEMLFSAGVNMNDYPIGFKRGSYFQRVKTMGKFTQEELEKLPPQHTARIYPNLEFERTVIKAVNLPKLSSIVNIVDVIFHGEEPNFK
jgi:tRNA(His) guanylyltransferase